VASSYNGLNRWKDGKLTIYRSRGSPREGATEATNEVVEPGLPSNGIESLFEDSRAEARRIEVEIQYGEREMRVRVRDDGKGMDPKVVKESREGHFGLPGMRERPTLMGGTLDVWSEIDSGTEVELIVAGSVAYTLGRRGWGRFSKRDS
jgi:hypothetical protein